MSTLEAVLQELGEMKRDDSDLAERAVARLYRLFRMRRPTVYWAESIHAALTHAESKRPANGTSDEILSRKLGTAYHLLNCTRDHDVLLPSLHSTEYQEQEQSVVLPRVLEACVVEDFEAWRTVGYARIDPKALHQAIINEPFRGEIRNSLLNHGTVLFRRGWMGMPRFVRVLALEAARRNRPVRIPKAQLGFLDVLVNLARHTYWAFLTDSYAVLAPPPLEFVHDEVHRIHCDTGPALKLADGREVFALRGTWVPADAVMAPHKLRVKDIEIEEDWDVRARLIEQYGLERYLGDAGAILWDKDEYGDLYWKAQHDQPPLVAVRVQNSTPEPDGSYQHYFLRVAPHIGTAREAVAWTFGMEEDEYLPTAET